MRDLLGRLEPALIHVNDIWWVPHTVRAAKGVKPGRIPLIVHIRQNIRPEKVRSYQLDQADVVLAVSNQVRTALEQGGLQSQRVKTLYSGVDLAVGGEQADQQNIRARYAIPPDALVIGTVGNLLPIKGYEVMIETFPSILAEVPSAHYLIVGAGSDEYSSRLRKLCRERGIADRIHFAEFQERTWSYLSAMDLYVQPSLDEAFGLAAVEAMAAGKAVVASRVGGLPEVVEHDQTGILVVPGDPSELSRAIVSLLRDGARRGQMGVRGAARARERFDHRAVVKATEQIYQVVLAGMGSA
jgi:glycosyltransferase involved in cell wall biosynthesis